MRAVINARVLWEQLAKGCTSIWKEAGSLTIKQPLLERYKWPLIGIGSGVCQLHSNSPMFWGFDRSDSQHGLSFSEQAGNPSTGTPAGARGLAVDEMNDNIWIATSRT